MYSDELDIVRTADSMPVRIEELGKISRDRAEEFEEPVEDVVYMMMHEEYLRKHSTEDVLSKLAELQGLYPTEFSDGEMAEHIMTRIEELENADMWTDYLYVSLAAGLEWAVLSEIEG